VAAAGCYGLKLAGLTAPRLRHPRVQQAALLLPVALLAGLVVVQTFSTGHRLTVDARAGGLAAAAVALALRAPFLVVVAVGALTAAGLRAL
jgi:uncharacterized membrane protein